MADDFRIPRSDLADLDHSLAPGRPGVIGTHRAQEAPARQSAVRTISLPRGLDDALRTHAESAGVTVSSVIREAIAQHLYTEQP